jgi:hypothetical protein
MEFQRSKINFGRLMKIVRSALLTRNGRYVSHYQDASGAACSIFAGAGLFYGRTGLNMLGLSDRGKHPIGSRAIFAHILFRYEK